MTPAEQDLVDRFEEFSAEEKAAALRGMAALEEDPDTRKKLIMAALQMDAIATVEKPGP